jgi:hypothetical protein
MFKYIIFNFELSKRLYVIFFQIILLVIYFILCKYKKLKNGDNFINYFSYSFNQNFFIIALIFYKHYRHLKKTKQNGKNNKISTVNCKQNGILIVKDKVKKKRNIIQDSNCKIIIIVVVICIIENFIRFVESLYLKNNKSYSFESLTLLMILLLSLFLRLQIYNHHLLVIIVSLLLTIFEIILQSLKYEEIISLIIFHLFLGVKLLLDNYVMEKYLVHPLLLFGLIGMFDLISNVIIFIVIVGFFKNKLNDIKNYFNDNNYKIFIHVIFVFLLRLNDIYIIYFYNPIYEVFPYFVMQIIVMYSDIKKNVIITILFSIFTIFNLLIALEIIILKFCGFDKNTKIEIAKRATILEIPDDNVLTPN